MTETDQDTTEDTTEGTTGAAQRFADALQSAEQQGDPAPLVEQFADGAELLRPEATRGEGGTQDSGSFWQAYLDQFAEIRTSFNEVHEADGHAVLEWESEGRLAAGRDIRYRGVSLLTLDDQGKVQRFATYYDTAAFVEPVA